MCVCVCVLYHKQARLELGWTYQTIVLLFCLPKFGFMGIERHLQSLVFIQQCLVCPGTTLQLLLQVFNLLFCLAVCMYTVSDSKMECCEKGRGREGGDGRERGRKG